MTSSSRLTYRPSLDGIRAVAVLLVFVFHAAPTALPGGFIGVDVFFVLSGYLITRLLVEEWQETGRIRLGRFYARRSRRLVPAIALVVAGVVVVESVWGSVLTAAARLRDSIATLFYVANWNLVVTADQYFAESDASPLRHAWSLAVEEQFYLVWPVLLVLLLLFVRRSGRKQAVLVAAGMMATLSFVLMAVLYEPGSIARVYYGTDTRIFQPLLGALLGIRYSNRLRGSGRPGGRWDICGGLALVGLVAAAFVLQGDRSPYYLGGALGVALLSILLVVALEEAPSGWTARLLSLRPVVGLGVISYGFYLWHWPVLQWLTSPDGASYLDRLLVNITGFTLTLALAVASHRLVEDPIRRREVWPWSRLSAMPTVVAGVIVLAAVATGGAVLLDGPAAGEATAAQQDDTSPVGAHRPPTEGASQEPLTKEERDQLALDAAADRSFRPCPDDPRPCIKVDGGPDADVVVLIGDSTAQAYDPALELLAEEWGFTYVQAAVGGCPIGHRLIATGIDGQRHKPSNLECFEQMPTIYDEVIRRWQPTLVLATSSNEARDHVIDDVVVPAGTPEHLAVTEQELRAVIDQFTTAGAGFVFIDVLPPGVGVDCLTGAQPYESPCSRPRGDTIEQQYNDLFGQLAAELDGVERISLTDLVCLPEACPLMRHGMVMRYDGGHLTATASRFLAPELASRLADVGQPLPGQSTPER